MDDPSYEGLSWQKLRAMKVPKAKWPAAAMAEYRRFSDIYRPRSFITPAPYRFNKTVRKPYNPKE